MLKNAKVLFANFSKLDREERLARLVELGALTQEDVIFLNTSIRSDITNLSEGFIENVIGCFPLPLGVATNFYINDRDYVIPMAVEETSIIAAASKTAKWIRANGHITTSTLGKEIVGQIQIAKVKNLPQLHSLIEKHKTKLIHEANEFVVPMLVVRGGGVTDLQVREIHHNGEAMAIIHVFLDPCDAMGANLMNQVCEYLKDPIELLTNETVSLCILSNSTDHKLTRAEVMIKNIDPQLGQKITEISNFAELDPYRAVTNNKGVLNGMDPILVATGNDWRAVEAGVHAYAARTGQYRSITHWQMQGKDLIGTLEAPILLGVVGGVTCLHPTANLCLKMLDVEHAFQLAEIVAAAGLVQNLGALRAIVTEGIIKGHMRLHIRNLILAVHPTPTEKARMQIIAQSFLEKNKKITITDIKNILSEIRLRHI